MNLALWSRQACAIAALDLRKTFFARRGLWIYLLALIPVLIFAGHSFERTSSRSRNAASATPGTTLEKLKAVRHGMTKAEVLALLPNPRQQTSFQRGNQLREGLSYSDGRVNAYFRLINGRVTRIDIDGECDLTEDLTTFAAVFQFFYLRLAIFFGCVFVFLNLFRGEMLDRSLHYYLLIPVRREVVVAGKFLAGLAATVTIFSVSTALQLAVFLTHFDAATLDQYLGNGGGWGHVAGYMSVAAMACLGYGSLFLAAGVLIRNPLIPAVTILIWESINSILPAVLRQLSVIYYLKSLCPVSIPVARDVPSTLAILALNVDPAPPIVAIAGLLALAAAVVTLAAIRARTLEINYSTES